MDERSPGYYAIIPATVRYDTSIPANAKLLYGEISALLNAEGFCFASNQYFADLYSVTIKSISRLISLLEQAGYLRVQIEKDKSGKVACRKIYLITAGSPENPVDKIVHTPGQNCGGGIDKNVQYTNTSINNTPQSPPKGCSPSGKQQHRSQYKAQADVLPDRFKKFWDFYRTHIPPDCNAGNRQKAIRAWDKLAPSDDLVTTMATALAAQVKSQTWLTGIGVPHASTWLNNHGWEDDWGPAAVPRSDSSKFSEDQESEETAEWVV